MAGALGVRLGGTNYYDGVAHAAPYLGARFSGPNVATIYRAAGLVRASSCAIALTLFAFWSAFEALLHNAP